ncbi:type IV pilin [Haloglomus salinum]|uniref:type IV pilin n=1 Tax=Haloglomus salinum TaxID=2962673 RepID=UPI0020C98099|nr:type IV pilin [Haloglomus salinum]
MPSRRQFLLSSAALGAATLPGTAAAASPSRPTADVDAALNAFGSGAVSGRIAPRSLPRIGAAADRVAAEAPAVADNVAGRLPSTADTLAARDGALGSLADAPLHVETVAPAIGGVAALAVGVDFTARGPVVRARVTGSEGAPARAEALDALAAAGLPVAALDPFAVRDGDDLALYAGVADRDDEQPFVLALLLVVLAAVVGTFVLGLGSSTSGSSSGGGSAREVPQVAFSFEYSADTQRVTITHDGGDSVDANELQVVYESDGSRAVERWQDDDGRVTAGDSFTTSRPIASGATLRVVWQSSDGNSGAVLGEFTAP